MHGDFCGVLEKWKFWQFFYLFQNCEMRRYRFCVSGLQNNSKIQNQLLL